MKFKLSGLFMTATLAAVALVILALGPTPAAAGLAVAVVTAAALMIEPAHMPTHTHNFQLGRVGEEEMHAEYERTQKELKALSDDLKRYAESSEKEVKRHASLSEETRANVDKMLTQQGELQARLQSAEQLIAKMEQGGGQRGVPVAENVGQLLAKHIEENEDARAFVGAAKRGQSIHLAVPRSSFRAALTNAGNSGGALTYPADVLPLVSPLVRRLTIRDLLQPGQTDKASIYFPRESGFTNNAGPQSGQGATKGKSTIEFEDITRNVITIAHTMDVSLQMLADVAYLQSYANGRMMYGLKFKEEEQLLLGSGVGNNLEGLYTAATAYAQPAGVVVTNEQALDRLRLMILQAELAEAFVSGIVMHPTDWANIELLKDQNRAYLFTNPQATTTGRLWGRDVVATQCMGVGDALVGDFAAHAQLLDREDAMVSISFENNDNFERNLATLRVEERCVLAIYRPEAFVKGEIGGISG